LLALWEGDPIRWGICRGSGDCVEGPYIALFVTIERRTCSDIIIIIVGANLDSKK